MLGGPHFLSQTQTRFLIFHLLATAWPEDFLFFFLKEFSATMLLQDLVIRVLESLLNGEIQMIFALAFYILS